VLKCLGFLGECRLLSWYEYASRARGRRFESYCDHHSSFLWLSHRVSVLR